VYPKTSLDLSYHIVVEVKISLAIAALPAHLLLAT
jgi:hypothetical protein